MVVLIIVYTFVAIVVSIFFIIYWNIVRPEKRIYDELRNQGIPGEPFVPIIGQLPQIRRARENDRVIEYLSELFQKHGNYFMFSMGPLPRIMISEPDLLADVLGRAHAQDYFKPTIFLTVFKSLTGTRNLLVREGLDHERARKMLNPAFHFMNLKSMVSIMADQTSKAIDQLLMPSDEKSIDFQKEFSSLTLAIIISCAFGTGLENMPNANEIIYRSISEIFEAIRYRTMRMISQIPLLAQLPFWRKRLMDENSRKVSDFVEQIIAARRKGRSASLCAGADLLDLLLSAVDDQGQPFSDQEVKDEALTFVVAGHETTANLMTWAMYVLMTNESVLRACREEVEQVLPNGMIPSYEHINNLQVCEAILQETLRLYTPVPWFVRKSIREHIIGSDGHRQVRIPVGTTVAIMTYMLHRRADLWPRPLEFDYMRWMRDPVTGLKPKLAHPFCYLPFAAGPRNCIGQNFALLEAKVMLAMFVQRCNFSIEPDQTIVPQITIPMRPKYGLKARVMKRS
ncbi:unnamed protein product [Rotaria sp. Silwood2]|nr:unnamed protein product [Rotaria sp. Silwood2]CAF4374623.1 unnamed protein product [Rotaria sp. Silwood2]